MIVKLSQNSWHYKLQSFVLEKTLKIPIFRTNFCPYFWLTIFCLIISPIFFPAMGIKWIIVVIFSLISWVIEKTINIFEKVFCRPLEYLTLRYLPDEYVYKYYLRSSDYYQENWNGLDDSAKRFYSDSCKRYLYHMTNETINEKFEKWKLIHKDWIVKLQKIKDKIIENKIIKEKRQHDREWVRLSDKRTKKNNDPMIKVKKNIQMVIVTITKYIAPVILLGLAISSCYGVYQLVRIIVKHWEKLVSFISLSWYKFMTILPCIGIVLATTFVIVVIVAIIKHIYENWDECMCRVPYQVLGHALLCTVKYPAFGFYYICRSIDKAIVNIFRFFFEAFKMFKEKHCPQIIWTDEGKKNKR